MANKRILRIAILTLALLSFVNKTTAQQATPETVAPALECAPVIPFQDTIFMVYGNIAGVTPEQRAQHIRQNIRELASPGFFNPDSLLVVNDEGAVNIVYQEKIIMGITDRQVKALGKPRAEIAQQYRQSIITTLESRRTGNVVLRVLKQLGLTAVILVATYFLLKLVNLLYRRLNARLLSKPDRSLKALSYVLDAGKQMSIWVTLLKWVRFAVVIIVLYTCVMFFFRLFPETRWLSDTLMGYITSPLKTALIAIKNYIPHLFAIVVIVFLFRLLAKGLRIFSEKVENGQINIKGFHSDWAMPTFALCRVVLYVFMFIFIFPHLPNSDSDVFKGVSVFMGVLFSLGSTSVISNMVSGMVITYMRPFKVGDRIKMGEFLGNVIEKTPLVTRIKTPKNEIITIPNGNILSAQTVNYTASAAEHGLILHSKVTMGYDIPWRKVHELLIEAAMATPNVLHEPKPFVLQIALDDFYVEYQINVYTRHANEMANIYSNLYKSVQDVFNREGIEMLSPHFHAQRDGSMMVMPQEYMKPQASKWPPFQVRVSREAADPNRRYPGDGPQSDVYDIL